MLYPLILLIILFYSITRGVPYLLSRLIISWYQTKIRIGSICLWRLSFEDVVIEKAQIAIKIERVGAASSLFNHDEKKIFALKLYDVRLEKTVSGQDGTEQHGEALPFPSSHGGGGVTNAVDQVTSSGVGRQPLQHQDSAEDEWHEANADIPALPSPKNFKIPPSVVTLAQFFAVRIVGASVMCLREAWPACLVHATAGRVDLEAATLNQTNVAFSVNIENCHVKVLQQVSRETSQTKSFQARISAADVGTGSISKQNKPPTIVVPDVAATVDHCGNVTTSRSSGRMLSSVISSLYGGGGDKAVPSVHHQEQVPLQDPSLLECSFSLRMYAELEAENDVAMEGIQLDLKSPNMVVRDRLFTFLQDKALASAPKATPTGPSTQSDKTNGLAASGKAAYFFLASPQEGGSSEAEAACIISHDTTGDSGGHRPLLAACPVLAAKLATYWLLVPQVVRVSVERAALSITSSSGGSDVQAELASLDGRLGVPRSPHTLEVVPALLPTVSCYLAVDGTKLTTSHHSSFALNRLKVDLQHRDRRILVESEVHSLVYWYDHRDLTAFMPHLVSFCRRKAEQPPSGPSGSVSVLTAARESLVCTEVVVGLWDIGIGMQLPTGPALYLSLYHSYLDTKKGTFLVEAFTSRLGKECCCVRPCRLTHCYCDAASCCSTGRCFNRRNSGSDFENRRNKSAETLSDQTDDNGVGNNYKNERRRGSTTSSSGSRASDEEASYSFLGKLGKQEYMAGIGGNGNEGGLGVIGGEQPQLSALSPFEQLSLLAEQRGGSFKQQHVWGTPLALGFCHVELSRHGSSSSAGLDPSLDEREEFDGEWMGPIGEFSRSYSRMSTTSYGSTTSGLHYNTRRRRGTASDPLMGGLASLKRASFTSIPDHAPIAPRLSTASDCSDGAPGAYKGGVHLDHLQVEWSPSLANFARAAKRYLGELEEIVPWKSTKRKKVSVSGEDHQSRSHLASLENVTLDCSNINMFAHTKYDVSLALRCDSVRTLRSSTAIFTGLRVSRFSPVARAYDCGAATHCQSGEVVGSIGVVSVVVVSSSGETLLEVQEHCRLHWCPNTHLTALAVAQDAAALMAALRLKQPADSAPAPASKSKLQLQVVAKGEVSASVQVSPRHEAQLTFNGLTFLTARGLTWLLATDLALHLDGHHLMQLRDGKLTSSHNSTELRKEREAFLELQLPINKAWKLSVVSWNITFPYNYNFAEAFSEDFISLIKWLKVIHKKVKQTEVCSGISDLKKFDLPLPGDGNNRPNSVPINQEENAAQASLPPDIIIKVDKWFVSVEDDPFEVKLRYNYELMEDEYQESCKRKKAFNSRIQDLQRSGAFLTAQQIEELHKSLKEKDSETYIKRSKQMYESTPGRSELFTWLMEDTLIFALADSTMNGTENALKNLESIDTTTSLPSGYEFSTLWCRLVSASVAEWRLLLRDYPQPLLHVQGLESWGRLLGAEQRTNKRGERTVVLQVAAPWHDGVVKRCLAPRKFYHDFTWEARNFTLAYGPCWEPAMTQFNIALSRINSPSLDPSLALPWWDKVRLLLHGRLLLLTEQFTLKLHASLDPYNTTEEMELTWNDLSLDWTNARLDFAGDLNVFVRTASKYDDARLLRLPHLRLSLKLRWVCHGDPDDHHAVMLCAPDKLPEYSSNQEHDSYRAFRSRNLDINISLETKTVLKNNVKINPVIEMLFYGSTLRWFENLKFILSGVTRPIRRGRVFGNAGPRRLQLSRHYRTIHLALSLQRFDVRYWMSVGVKKGFHLSGERLSLSSEHSLTLEPRNSGLHQRSLSRWSVVYLNTELWQAQMWLQSVLLPPDDPEDNPPHANDDSKKATDGKRGSESRKTAKDNEQEAKKTTEAKKGSTDGRSGDGEKSGKSVADARSGEGGGVDKKGCAGEEGKDSPGLSPKSVKSDTDKRGEPATPQVEKFYFLNVTKVAYMRETLTAGHPYISAGPTESPNHRLVVHHLKGAWTTNNRDIVLALYDSWNKSQQLKHNLSPDVLKTFAGAGDTVTTPQKPATAVGGVRPRHKMAAAADPGGLASPAPLQAPPGLEATPSPLSRLQSGSGAELLHQLIKEADNNYVAYSEDCSNTSEQPRDSSLLHGVTDCITDDVVCKRWLIELVNSQVLLKGCDTQGYVIISAAKSQVIQRVHRPVWRQQTLNSKTTWYGSLECMQYYATVSPSNKAMQMDNILWLSVANIEERGDTQQPLDLTDIVGSNQSAGGVVTNTVGAAVVDNSGHTHTQDMQLQRIVSRCRCEFYYACYGELGVEPELLGEVQPPPPPTDELWGDHRDPTDTFTLMHHDLCISTNSLQYNMVVDILNKLLLYVDPVKKAASSALARMRFQLQLSSGDDQKKPIVKLQNQLRNNMSQLRGLEKDVYLVQRALDRDPCQQLVEDKAALTAQVAACKERQNSLSQELAIRIHCYNESQLRANHKLSTAQGDKVTTIRMNEVFFRKAQWRLTEADGQLGIAEVALSNFLYTKKNNSDDSGEHLLELRYVNMKNLLPNQVYTDVLAPTTLTSACPLDRQKTLRIFCREKPPCGGISVIDHFEINVVPLDISLTYQFYKTILKFCFPDTPVSEDAESRVATGRRQPMRRPAPTKNNKDTQFYVQLQKDDVEIMKQRAEQNKMFVYIKIPELKVRLSYKGMKDKNLSDVTNFRLVVPSLEYHNVTWTWLDFMNGLKEHCKSALLPQVIKIKLNVIHKASDSTAELDEEEKARLLLGDRHLPQNARNTKKGLFKFKR